MINRFVPDLAAALAGVSDGASIMLGGFGQVGQPVALLEALADMGLRDLTIIANNAGAAFGGMTRLLETGAVGKVVCSYPRSSDSTLFQELYAKGRIKLELTPQGTLVERMRAAGAGIPAFFTPTAAGTLLGAGKETREINGRLCVLEEALFADYALLEAWEADRWGNLSYKLSGRNFNPVMAAAAKITIAQCRHKVELGGIDPDDVITPGIYVDRVVHVPEGETAV
ncbi:MAG: 3-oxoacid CoA-transferase subunit A [Acidocella sp.]|nr:3-oxoacid CoA-transferase subunit A [Acidocella sp.]